MEYETSQTRSQDVPVPTQRPSAGQMFLSLWKIKLLMLVTLTLTFCVIYIYLAHNPFFKPMDVPRTWIDHAIPFQPSWIWVYQSVYLLTATLPLLAHTREQLRRWLIGYTLLTGTCFLIYIFLPTQIERHIPSGELSPMYRLLLMYDGNCNALPSLHVGFLWFTLSFARRVYGPAPRWANWGLAAWFILIGYSTLATKEHFFLDLIAGIGVAAVADRLTWSRLFGAHAQTQGAAAAAHEANT